MNKKLGRGQISLSWLNKYSCILFRSPYTSILIDPVDIDPSIFDKLDAILITQDAFDHLDESLISEIQSKTNCIIIADTISSNKLSQIPEEKIKIAHAKDEFQIDECRIYVERSATSLISPLTYIIVSEEGTSVYHTSDSGPFEEMKIIGEKYKIDVCFCAVGFTSKVNPKTGFEIVKLIKPKVALPYHGVKLKEFVNLVSKKIPNVKAKVLKIGEEMIYP
jgi:L-ascorbate metabolism protein UlaG (beta-lactamase superfamily)